MKLLNSIRNDMKFNEQTITRSRCIKLGHFISGIILATFVLLHLYNHSLSMFGVDQHLAFMTDARKIYRNQVVELILMCAISFQLLSGIYLFVRKRKSTHPVFDRLQIYSGLYLAIFFLVHLSAVWVGRLYLKLDTNYYFGVAGLTHFPFNLFFIPYYALAILSFFTHIAAVHHSKMKSNVFGLSPVIQSIYILVVGVILTCLILSALIHAWSSGMMPQAYKVLIGK